MSGRRTGAGTATNRAPPLLLALFLTVGLAACGGATRAAPDPVDPPAEPEAGEAVAVRESLLTRLERRSPPPPPRPWLPHGVQWSPSPVREGEAFLLRVHEPRSGRRAETVTGRLDGRPVRFARAEDGWFGIGAAPIGAAGDTELELRFRVSPDSTVTQTARLRIESRDFPATRLSVAPRYSDPSPEALARIREERELIRATLAQVTPEWLPERGFMPPREARITSPFGQRRLFNEQLRSRHTGVDYAGETGAPVRAAARGRVALVGDFYFTGNAVFLDHGLGVYTGYFHLSKVRVSEGDIVSAGARIGDVGSTGRVTGPHLHWSLYVGGESLDARSLLRMELPGRAARAR